jgi:hypothetical protein
VALSATHVAFSAVRMDPTWMSLGQAAGTAAALAVRQKKDVRGLDVKEVQRELIGQKARLMFYWDVPLEHPAFAAVQWLSVRGAVQGFPDRRFRPEEPLTRAQLAAVVMKAYELWPSVSDVHFRDVGWDHWAFREVETLFDHRLLGAFGVEPRWPRVGSYKGMGHAGFSRPAAGAFGAFEPDKAVTWGEFARVLRDCGAASAAGREGAAVVTRGEAAMALAAGMR